MLRLAAISLLVVVAAAFASAGAPTFTVCDAASSLLTDVTITSDSQNWQPDSTVHFTVTGNLKESFSSGDIKTTAFFDGIQAEDKTDPLCTYSGSPFKCPEAAGTKSWTFPFAIPSVPWPGTLSSHSDFRSSTGAMLWCMDLKVDL